MAIALLLAACVIAAQAAAGAPAARAASTDTVSGEATVQAGPTLRLLHWNIAGSVWNPFDLDKPDNRGHLEVVERLVQELEARQPYIISLNEACRHQVDYVVQQLWLSSFNVDMHFADSEGGNFYCEESGPAIIAVNVGSVWDKRTYYFNDDGSYTSTPRERAAACMLGSYVALLNQFVRMCSTHLDSDPNIAKLQAATLAGIPAEEGVYPYPTVLLGDFNATPDVLLDSLYAPEAGGSGRFVEVDMHMPDRGRPTFAWPNPGRKIDYIFGDSDHFTTEVSAEVIDGGKCRIHFFVPEHPCSDHFMVAGTLTFRDDLEPFPGPPYDPEPTPPTPPADSPPFVRAGPDVTGDEGSPVELQGSASDDRGAPELSWSYQPGAGVDPGTTCSFSNPDSVDTTMTCTDDGTFTARLTASDGVNAPVTDSATVTIRNVAPRLDLTAPAAWQLFRAGTPVNLTAPFTDPGTNDTHTCTVAWDDGGVDSYPAQSGGCGTPHTFAHPGMYTMDVTVTDDDGGSGSAEVMVVVYDPDAGFATAGGFIDSPPGALSSNPAASGKGTFPFTQMYHNGEEVPEGKASFKLEGTDFDFDSRDFEWLVVTPDNKVALKGEGSVAGQDGYGFVLYGYDEPDRYRLVVWPLSAGPIPGANILYDNRRTASYDVDLADPQPASAGSITIHRPS